jgi:SulP family sulfate permease
MLAAPTPSILILAFFALKFYGVNFLAFSTMLAGIILLVMSLLHAGQAFKYIPYPVGFGINFGVAILLFGTQIKNALGMADFDYDHNFWQSIILNIKNYFNHLEDINLEASLIAAAAFLIAFGIKSLRERLPNALITLLIAVLGMYLLNFKVDLINASPFAIADFNPGKMWEIFSGYNWQNFWNILPLSFTLAVVIAMDTILAAVVIDNLTARSHNSNKELIALGTINITSSFFCGIPFSGSIAGATTNVNSGAQSIVSKLLAPALAILLLEIFTSFFVYIPVSASAALIMLAMLGTMLQKEAFMSIFRSTKSDFFVFLTSFILCIFSSIIDGILWGIFLYAILFIKNSHEKNEVENLANSRTDILDYHKKIAGVEIITASGPLFFGAFSSLHETIQSLGKNLRILVLRMDNVKNMDISIFKSLETFIKNCAEQNIEVILAEVSPKPLKMLEKASLTNPYIHLANNVSNALSLAQKILKKNSK